MEEKFTVRRAKSALYNEIKNYNKKYGEIKELKSKVGICEDIISILKLDLPELFHQVEVVGFFLDMIYDEVESNNIYKKISATLAKSAFTNDEMLLRDANTTLQSIIQKIEEKQEELSLECIKTYFEIENEKHLVKKYEYILRNIKHDGYIGNSDKQAFINLMHKYGASDAEIVEMFERIDINYQNKKNNNKDFRRYRIINMLNAEYQPYEISELEDYNYKKICGPIIDSIYDSLMKDGIEYMLEYLQEIFNENTKLEEFDYILKNVINRVIGSLQESIENIKDIEMYSELKHVIICEYNTSLQSFKLLKEFYNIKTEQLNNDKELEEIKTDDIEQINKLIYLPNMSSTYLESDLKNIPEEFYLDVIKLLNNLKTGQLTDKNCRPFNGNKKLKTYRELRDDQLRILIKNAKENIYVVLGIFQKQDDNDLKRFLGLANRYNSNNYINEIKINELLEQSDESDERIYSFLKENVRKGNR